MIVILSTIIKLKASYGSINLLVSIGPHLVRSSLMNLEALYNYIDSLHRNGLIV